MIGAILFVSLIIITGRNNLCFKGGIMNQLSTSALLLKNIVTVNNTLLKLVLLSIFISSVLTLKAQVSETPKTTVTSVAEGWANNSVNAVVFRKNSLVTYKDTQYIAFYDNDRYVIVGKRRSGAGKWEIRKSQYQGNAADAHNMISLMVDDNGYLHLAWDHHNNPLRYCRSAQPGSLELTDKMPMTGKVENKVSYPEFYKLPSGDLIFLYRDGGSGQGNLVINSYSIRTKQWRQLYSNLINGQGQRSAYWQACVDTKGTIHLSWVWRETPDVASNHDMCYARSTDYGKTWEKSTGEKYQIPVSASTAEYAFKVPQKSELINQTSMVADAAGHPYIATYWRDSGLLVPQYRIIYKDGSQWISRNPGFRKTTFSLSGGGTKAIPVSRPQIITWQSGKTLSAALIFRDEERGSKASAAITTDISKGNWKVIDLTTTSVGSWEPSYDTELWKDKGILNLFIQKVEQLDAEGKANVAPQMVQVLEWNPKATSSKGKK